MRLAKNDYIKDDEQMVKFVYYGVSLEEKTKDTPVCTLATYGFKPTPPGGPPEMCLYIINEEEKKKPGKK